VIVPDFGGAFGGKHTGECAVEAARLAKGAGKPVSLRWTRAEEFTWAYFRPAAAIDIEAALDDNHMVAAWHFVNINSGGAGLETPYRVAKKHEKYVSANKPPLRHGSYRALASTANVFARESFMDELAALAGADPLAFRLEQLEESRLRDVLKAAAEKFGWPAGPRKASASGEQRGVGLACATEKGSFVAACAEVAVDRAKGTITVLRVCQAFECGKITSPGNLHAQVAGAIVMGLGPALREAMVFENGKMTNASFWQYEVPRIKDLPELDIHLLDRPDLASTGAGETPLIAVAPAIANAVFRAAGVRLRSMPLRLPEA
jgi:isoquinoline 1-oxidoreductase